VLHHFRLFNEEREKMKDVERQILGILPNAPFNALFDLLDTHGLPIDWQDFVFKGSAIKEFNDNGDVVKITEINCLCPGLKYVANVGDEPIIFHKCWECEKMKEAVEEEKCCASYGCNFEEGPVCRKCSKYITCSSCGRKGCQCVFKSCCVEGCFNKMCVCEFFSTSESPAHGNAVGCGFVLFPPDDEDSIDSEAWSDAYDVAENGYEQYCEEHKPDGAVPYTGEYEL
jgi:hypothetical protein